MNNFQFQNPVKILFGEGKIAEIAHEIAAGSKVMMTYGGGSIKRNGIYDQVIAALSQCQVIEFGGIEANPDYDTLMRAISLGKSEEIDFILAVGGGSIIDGTKFIPLASITTATLGISSQARLKCMPLCPSVWCLRCLPQVRK